ncbi:uncharacterized protein LOC142776609 isoform X3 [Rhipicephalus microplus]|uniref:uncharacterized protein LOC142776609 isoform X3 n=1 Tax=Rhipicephalus microplus TaxID=6941 RepID=UPI003F6D7373
MWPGSKHGSLILKDCDLLGSFEGTKLLNGWLQGHSISIRQDTGMNNNGSSRNYASSVSETVQETPISDMTVLADFSRVDQLQRGRV